MATYKGIQGYTVQSLSDDPATLGNVVGQLWYNSSTGKFKVGVQAAGAWSAGDNLNTARNVPAQGGTTTAAVCFGGNVPPVTDKTETYDGSSWTEVGDLNTARSKAAGSGITTAAMLIGGSPSPPGNTGSVELYDGTSWTEVADMATARETMGGGGSQVAALAFGGDPGHVTTTEEWAIPNATKTFTAS